MNILLCAFWDDPGGSIKRQPVLSQGGRLALHRLSLMIVLVRALARVSQALSIRGHVTYTSTLLHAMQIVFIPAKWAYSCLMCVLWAPGAFLVVCEGTSTFYTSLMSGHVLVRSCTKQSALRRTAMGRRAIW